MPEQQPFQIPPPFFPQQPGQGQMGQQGQDQPDPMASMMFGPNPEPEPQAPDFGIEPFAPLSHADFGNSQNPSGFANQLVNAVNFLLKEVADLRSQIPPPTQGTGSSSGTGGALRFGKADATWTTGNTVLVHPCKSATDGTLTGEADVTCYVDSPSGATPKKVVINANDILAFESDPNDSTTGNLMPTLVQYDTVSVPTIGSASNAAATFDTFNAPATFNSANFLTDFGAVLSITCSGGTITATQNFTKTFSGALTGVATTQSVLKSVATTVLALTSAGNDSLVLKAPT